MHFLRGRHSLICGFVARVCCGYHCKGITAGGECLLVHTGGRIGRFDICTGCRIRQAQQQLPCRLTAGAHLLRGCHSDFLVGLASTLRVFAVAIIAGGERLLVCRIGCCGVCNRAAAFVMLSASG